jgi:uncharacterized protein YkwD
MYRVFALFGVLLFGSLVHAEAPPPAEKLLAQINTERQTAGAQPLTLDAQKSAACSSHAEYLVRNAAAISERGLSVHDEDLAGLGGTEPAREVASHATVLRGDPTAAVAAWLKAPGWKAYLLRRAMTKVAIGSAGDGEKAITVIAWPPSTTPNAPVLCPAPEQTDVDCLFPGTELPDPLPSTEEKVAGYPITVTFPPGVAVVGPEGWLEDNAGKSVPFWFSTPAVPANPKYRREQQNSVCIIARKPLEDDTDYVVRVKTKADGKVVDRVWRFATRSDEATQKMFRTPFLNEVNAARKSAGLEPLELDARMTAACRLHTRYLARNPDKDINLRDEIEGKPGYTLAGRDVARRGAIHTAKGTRPLHGAGWILGSVVNRTLILNPAPTARKIGLACGLTTTRGWVLVVDLPTSFTASPDRKGILYPGDGQKDVPLYGRPDLQVEAKVADEGVGFVPSLVLPFNRKVTNVSGEIRDSKDEPLESVVFSPGHPIQPGSKLNVLAVAPRVPLKSASTYKVVLSATVDGSPWKRAWSFTTADHAALEEKAAVERLAEVNAYRKACGLKPVVLDEKLSAACRAHARYLVRNWKAPAVKGLGVHKEDMNLPGATPEGARAAGRSVIADSFDVNRVVTDWMGTLYHRIPLISPDLQKIGYGQAQIPSGNWAPVLDARGGR